MTTADQGNLADKSLGELICEIQGTAAAGALRISRERAKTVIYFEDGNTVFAVSNIRAHRLIEFLKRSGVTSEDVLANMPPTATDDELLAQLITQAKISYEQVEPIRANQVADILRATLLWTEGSWQFDPRVRVAKHNRVSVDTERLLRESTRHLPGKYIESRFANRNEQVEAAQQNGHEVSLSPNEAYVLSRVTGPTSIKNLLAMGGLPEAETLRVTYALIVVGLLKRGPASTSHVGDAPQRVRPTRDGESLEDFLARIDKASDYYETLDIDRTASPDDVKNAYHALARSYHPDRFHQAAASVRTRIDSAFARIAHAYEVLHDTTARAAYDDRLKTAAAKPAEKTPSKPASSLSTPLATSSTPIPRMNEKETGNEDRAEASFQKGLLLLNENQPQHALRLFAEAASLEPRRARYRAEYGRALTNDQQTRRLAEIELKAAIALEPNNVSYRVALAELYKALGLRRRAEGELQRALSTDPHSDAARKLLASLKNQFV